MTLLGRWKALWPQWLATFLVVIAMAQCGIGGAWSSPYLVMLTSENSTLPLTLDEASWVASLMNLGRIFGAVIGGVAVQAFGSKMGLLAGTVPYAVSWVLIGLASNAAWLYIARIFSGLGMGMLFSAFPLYLGEIADPSIRGCLISIAMFGGSMGNVLVTVVALFADLQVSSLVFLLLCVVFIVSYSLLPESPHHLARTSTAEKTKAAIRWYDRTCDVELSYSAIKKFIESSKSLTSADRFAEFKRPEMRKGLFIVLTLFMYSQMSGLSTIVLYMEMIFTDAKVTFLKPSTVVIIESGVSLIGIALAMYLIDRLGRKSLLIISSTGVILSLSTLAGHFILLDSGYDPVNLQAIPVASMTIYQLSVMGGFLTVPSTVLSETLPPSIKCIAACAGNAVGALSAFICSKTFQMLLDAVGQKCVYWIYAGIILTAIPFAVFCMPETKGKSLQQIQDEMTRGRKSQRRSTQIT